MIPDRLLYAFEHCWNDHKCDQVWALGPRSYHKNILKLQEHVGTSLKNVIITDNLKLCKYWKVCVFLLLTFEISKNEIRKLEI